MCHLCAFDRNDDTAEKCRQCGADLEALEDSEDDAETESAWFHYLQIPGVGTIELVPGRAFRFGRDGRNELVIPRVQSPEIATVFWTDDYDEATIRDSGAPEGTKIDGVKLTGTRTLKGGEDVVVGPLRMTYLRRATRIANAIDAQRTSGPRPNPGAQIPEPANAPIAHHRKPTFVRSGKTRQVAAPPAAVCQALEVKKTSGTLRVQTTDARGWITVVLGHPRHAAFEGKTGLDALFAILSLPRARCIMTAGVSARGAGHTIEPGFKEAVAMIARLQKITKPHPPTPAPRPGPPTATGRTQAPPRQGPGTGTGRTAPPRPPGGPPPRTPPRPGTPPPRRPPPPARPH
jgi:hypothetical protein